MRLTRIETFTGPRKETYTEFFYQNDKFNRLVNNTIKEYEDDGFEVSNVFKEIKDGLIYICIEFTKEGETDETR